MSTYKQHLDLAGERFQAAQDQFKSEKVHTAAHLFINAAINYNNALCQKALNKIPRHKAHSDTSYFRELGEFLGADLQKYKGSYEFLMGHKSDADYGTHISFNIAKQIYRRASIIKEIIEHRL